jgi:hypothetical protein
MNLKRPYLSPEAEINLCEGEIPRTRKSMENAMEKFDEATTNDEREKFDAEISKFEMRLNILQKKYAQLIFTKFGESVTLGKINWR